MQINELFNKLKDSGRMDQAIAATVKFLNSNSKVQEMVNDSNKAAALSHLVEKTLLMVGKRMAVQNIKKLYDRFHSKIDSGSISEKYRFYSSIKLKSNDPRLVHVTESIDDILLDLDTFLYNK
jgi:hypothetical protein